MKYLLIFACFVLLLSQVASESFNIFKDYSKEKIKPNRYAKFNTKHDVSEYMSPQQKAMRAQRHGRTTPDNSFDNNWSGYDKITGKNPITSRRLRGAAVSSKETLLSTLDYVHVKSSQFLDSSSGMAFTAAVDNISMFTLNTINAVRNKLGLTK